MADRMAGDAPPAADGGWLEPADTDRLLASMAERLSVAPEALVATDRDMFLAYQAPYSFVTAGKSPESVRLLKSFARQANSDGSAGAASAF